MTTSALLSYAFGIAAIVLILIAWRAAKPRKRDEFDGGYSYENEDVRVTRVHSPYVISKGD